MKKKGIKNAFKFTKDSMIDKYIKKYKETIKNENSSSHTFC